MPAVEDDGQHGPGSTLLAFRVYWIDHAGRFGASTDVRAHDLSAAISRACARLKRPGTDAGAHAAHGFYVCLRSDGLGN